ncbi:MULTISPECIES: PotD/PotF family extracellular solute-binding protein [Halorussus]|uniref:ABC transporter substrate-binding protein n=1 Tax=Halorussus TaxID=1070314 RepID=UPI000E20FF12|nr:MULTISPECIES: PotD/PotF family extracellular solute-binding protein [Halorussus]NHN60603.1 extracellular solute-binding protein [Halorussus sp. JP-T4]
MTHEKRQRNANGVDATNDPTPSRRRFLGAVGATGLAGASVVGTASGQTPTLNVLTWEEYGDPKLLQPIQEQVGVDIQITRSTSSAKMFSSWNAGQYRQYDIAIPNNNYVPKMMNADLLAPVPEGVVTNQQNIYDTFQGFAQNQFTANGQRYGVPVRFGWYGYSYDSRKIPDHEPTREILFSENFQGTDLRGQIVMYDNHFKAMSGTALYLGMRDAFEGQRVTLSEDQIAEVKQTMIDQKPLLQGYIAADPTYIKSFRQGNFLVGQSGRNEIVEMWANGDDWPEMAVPQEGALAWFESAVVSKASNNKQKAWEVVNEYISPKLGATLAKVGYSPSVNPATQEYLTEEQNQLYGAIDPAKIQNFIPFKAVENEQAWIQAWEEIKVA